MTENNTYIKEFKSKISIDEETFEPMSIITLNIYLQKIQDETIKNGKEAVINLVVEEFKNALIKYLK